MADISTFLADIMAAVYGEDVRKSIHDAIDIINQVSEVVFSTGTAVTSTTSSSTGFFEDSLYLNTNTYELWKCVGTNSWQSLGILKGDTGNGIDNITKTSTAGLVDTYTITYTDGNTETFTVTNGADGNQWYRGTDISGKAPLPTVYPSSGITKANVNDFYLNPSEGAVYHCVSGGNASTATWSYDFTMTGGGGSTAHDVSYSNTSSGLTATDVQDAIDELDTAIDSIQNGTTLDSFSDVETALSDKADDTDLDIWFTPTTAGDGIVNSSGEVEFHGLDDTQGWGFMPYLVSNTLVNFTAQLTAMTNGGTNSMYLKYKTNASNGATVKLRILK